MASDDNKNLDISLDNIGEEDSSPSSSFDSLLKTHPHNMGNVATISPKPTLVREPAPTVVEDTSDFMKEQGSLLDLCSSISSDVSHLGLEEVSAHTIEYVDNNNKSVLLINKHLLTMGKKPIPVIAPGLAPHYLETIPLSEAKQGTVLLYTVDGENASLGILMSKNSTDEVTSYKTLTTDQDKVVVIHLTEDQVRITMR